VGRWASEKIRAQRRGIIIEKHLLGWRVKDIALHIGLKPGSVSNVIKRYQAEAENK